MLLNLHRPKYKATNFLFIELSGLKITRRFKNFDGRGDFRLSGKHFSYWILQKVTDKHAGGWYNNNNSLLKHWCLCIEHKVLN